MTACGVVALRVWKHVAVPNPKPCPSAYFTGT